MNQVKAKDLEKGKTYIVKGKISYSYVEWQYQGCVGRILYFITSKGDVQYLTDVSFDFFTKPLKSKDFEFKKYDKVPVIVWDECEEEFSIDLLVEVVQDINPYMYKCVKSIWMNARRLTKEEIEKGINTSLNIKNK